MEEKKVHIIKHRNKWCIKKHGIKRAFKICDDYEDALVYCVENFKPKGYTIICHNKDGYVKKVI
jgi:hypothetical protein